MRPRAARIAALTAALLAGLATAPALAHDTWFAPLPGAARGELRLALGTGNRFPVQETSVGAASLVAAACSDTDGRSQALQVWRDTTSAVHLRWPGRAADGRGLSCWAQQAPQHLTLTAPVVAVYLDEIRAGPALRQRWAELASRGVPWVERYTKHARFESGDGDAAPRPLPLGLDIVPDAARPVAGAVLGFTVQRDGQPLPGQPVELVNAASGLGFWLRTDQRGRAEATLPLAGDWLLRAVDLRPDPQQSDAWDSRFVTLAFRAGAAAGM